MNSNTMNELGMLADALPGGSRYEITVWINNLMNLMNWTLSFFDFILLVLFISSKFIGLLLVCETYLIFLLSISTGFVLLMGVVLFDVCFFNWLIGVL